MKVLGILCAIVLTFVLASAALAQTVKITPLGSHRGEFCANDRALLFEDPTGVRVLYDVGRSVAGAADARLGAVHVVLLSHAHGDHIGDTRAAAPDAGTCERPTVVSAAPHSNTAEIAAAKNAAVVVSNDMGAFLGKKIRDIRGIDTAPCPTTGIARETVVPPAAPCVANLQLGGRRAIKEALADRGMEVILVRADHSNGVPRTLLSEPARSQLAADALPGYVGHANGYVLAFTNGLRAYLSGDTAPMGDMRMLIKDFYRANLAVLNVGAFALQSEEGAYVAEELIQPAAVIVSHANEAATAGGKVRPGSKTKELMDLVKGRPIHVPLSGKTMEFDGRGRCVAGC